MLNKIAESLVEKPQKISNPETISEQKIVEKIQEVPEKVVEKSSKPLGNIVIPSKFSILEKLNQKEEENSELFVEKQEENLPNDHFTETDLHDEWSKFLEKTQKSDIVVYNAINGFKIHKKSENEIEILYPSDLSKSEFDKVKEDFLNHFKHKVNHYKIEVSYTKDEINLKKEIVTKRTVFEKFVQINPLLKDLDDLMKFDFS